MCFKEVFKNWGTILKISSITMLTVFILEYLSIIILGDTFSGIFVGGIMTAIIILNRNLKKDDWGILFGFSLSVIFYILLVIIYEIFFI